MAQSCGFSRQSPGQGGGDSPRHEGHRCHLRQADAACGLVGAQSFGFQDVWIWTSEGSSKAGTVKLHKARQAPTANAKKANFTVKASVDCIVEQKGKGDIGLVFELPTKPPEKAVTKVYLEVAGADPDPESSSGTCLKKADPTLAVEGSYRVNLSLRSLLKSKVVTIVTYRKEGKEKIHHPAIDLEVR